MRYFNLRNSNLQGYALAGTFASDAFIEGGFEAMSHISGTKFRCLLSNGRVLTIDKRQVAPFSGEIKNPSEIFRLLLEGENLAKTNGFRSLSAEMGYMMFSEVVVDFAESIPIEELRSQMRSYFK